MNERDKKESNDKSKGIQQVPIRFHINDLKALKKILIDEDLSIQGFVMAATAAMIDGDARMTQICRAWKTEREIPHEERSKYTLSKRERDSLLEQLEGDNKKVRAT